MQFTTKIKKGAAAISVAVVLGFSSFAHAGVIFTPGNHPEADEENILFGDIQSGFSLTGTSNQSGVDVDFTSTHMIYLQGGGQAMIEATNRNPNRVDITNLAISAEGYTFRDLIFNMLNGHGTATITANTVASGSFTYNMLLGNGQNFLTVLATDGDMMTSLLIQADGFKQLKQPRISGVTPEGEAGGPPAAQPVPEPFSLGLLGLGLMATAFIRRRRI